LSNAIKMRGTALSESPRRGSEPPEFAVDFLIVSCYMVDKHSASAIADRFY